jgi:inhibitor of cysteine peptidase
MTDVRLTEGSNGKDVFLKVGQTFSVTLPENPTTGYRWIFVQKGGPTCSLVSDSFEPRTQRLGSPGVHEWHFRVDAPGTATVEMRLAREWDPPNSATRSLLLHLHVT